MGQHDQPKPENDPNSDGQGSGPIPPETKGEHAKDDDDKK